MLFRSIIIFEFFKEIFWGVEVSVEVEGEVGIEGVLRRGK